MGNDGVRFHSHILNGNRYVTAWLGRVKEIFKDLKPKQVLKYKKWAYSMAGHK